MQGGGPPYPEEDINIKNAVSVVNAMKSAPRFLDCEILGYENHIDQSQEKQFAAFSVLIGKKQFSRALLVVFRGTDMSLVGWKEDLNMSFIN
jgi:hypothetical protein